MAATPVLETGVVRRVGSSPAESTSLSIPDEFMEDLFGDHTTVTVKRDGTIKTEQCEHD